MRRVFFNLFVLAWLAAPLSAGIHETLPIFHWAYDYIDELRVRGYLENLFILNKPFTRGQIAAALNELEARIDRGDVALNRTDAWLIDRLRAEFAVEMQHLGEPEDTQPHAEAGVFLLQEVQDQGADTEGHLRWRSKLSVELLGKLGIYNGMLADNLLDEDSTYIGKRQADLAALTEQAYVMAKLDPFQIKLGRDFIRFGPGRSGTLLFSDAARPLDHLWVAFTYKFLKFSFFAANLDAMMVPDTTAGRLVRANRFLSAHRLEFKVRDRFYFGITEAIVYGGPQSNWELGFLNPFVFYHGVQLNGPVTGNTFGAVDFALYPWRNFSLFGELMIDDVQLESGQVGDLEPDEIGFLVGLQVTNPLAISGTQILAEYTRVTNRTYNTLDPWEKFLHRGQPIGHFLGNDFDRWDVNLSQWVLPGLQLQLGYERVRRGEGRVEDPFDRPWLEATLEEGYSEPFPFGTVETANVGKFGIIYHPWTDLRLTFFGQFRDVNNLAHQERVSDADFRFRLSLWYEGNLRFGL